MRPIRYCRVESEQAAIQAGHEAGAAFIAGGTSLIDVMKLEAVTPSALVDVTPLPLGDISRTQDGGARIGALVRNSDLAYHDLITSDYPLLSEALLSGASPQVRNMATVGGNLLQRTRCYYFRDPGSPCNKREPGSGCSAVHGQQRIHAILGGSERCIAVHPSDMCVALVALDATVHSRGSRGERITPFTDFHVTPGEHPERESILEPGELITAITLPSRKGFAQSRYVKVRDRASFAFALASAAAVLRMQDGVIRDARVALGGVATKPWRATEAEAILVGSKPSGELFQRAATAAVKRARTYPHNMFKVELIKRTIVRALETIRV